MVSCRALSKKNVTRTDGKLSHRSILEATLGIILESGIRSVKYKTVAEVAGVTQSAVAYYFSSIPVLIEESFRFYFEKYTQEMTYTRHMGQRLLHEFAHQDLQSRPIREDFLAQYSGALMALLGSATPELKVYLLLDRIFRNETLINKSLYRILKVQDQADIDAIHQLFIALKTKQPEEEAIQFMSLLWFLGERLLQENYSEQELNRAKHLISNMLEKILLS